MQLTGTGRNDGEIKNYPAAGGLPFLVMEKQSGTNSTTEGGFYCQEQELKRNTELATGNSLGSETGLRPRWNGEIEGT